MIMQRFLVVRHTAFMQNKAVLLRGVGGGKFSLSILTNKWYNYKSKNQKNKIFFKKEHENAGKNI